MIKSVTVTNPSGESLKMVMTDPVVSGFNIIEITGIGPSNASINTTELVTYDGSVYNSSRVQQRNIVFTLQFWEDDVFGPKYRPQSEWTRMSIEDLRHQSYRYFPIKQRVELAFETDTRILTTYGYVEKNEPTIFAEKESTQVSIICPEAYFDLGGDYKTQNTDFSSVEAAFEFPIHDTETMKGEWENNNTSASTVNTPQTEFSRIVLTMEKNLYYSGDASTGVTIVIQAEAEISGLSITNVNTKEELSVDQAILETAIGGKIKAGDVITINTTQGQKSAIFNRNGVETNILNAIGRNSSWLQIHPGDNVFSFAAAQGQYYANVTIQNKTLFEGV